MHVEAKFLPDDVVVLDEPADFLDDEFVIEEEAPVSSGTEVVFAGPSDAPPAATGSPLVVRVSTEARGQGRAAYLASVGLAGLMAAALSVRFGVARTGTEQGRTAADVRGGAGRAIVAPAATATAPATTPATATATTTATATAPTTTTDTPGAGDPPSESPESIEAAEAKKVAQQALERGNTKAAVEQGERSVELDPGDAEAWLILGAAYMQRGNYRKARGCFSSCADQATRGARAECVALAR